MQDDQVKDQKDAESLSDRNVKDRKIAIDGTNENAGNEQNGSEDIQEKSTQGYFRSYRGSTMTIVFHAVLSPYFKFDQVDGDRIFMRFGGPMFGAFNEDVVEVFPER